MAAGDQGIVTQQWPLCRLVISHLSRVFFYLTEFIDTTMTSTRTGDPIITSTLAGGKDFFLLPILLHDQSSPDISTEKTSTFQSPDCLIMIAAALLVLIISSLVNSAPQPQFGGFGNRGFGNRGFGGFGGFGSTNSFSPSQNCAFSNCQQNNQNTNFNGFGPVFGFGK